jgi:protein CpxP
MRRVAVAIVAVMCAGAAVTLTTGRDLAAQAAGGQAPAVGRGGPGGPGGLGRFGGPGGRGGPGGGPLAPIVLGRLNLTDTQKDQVRAIVDAQRDETRALADRARAARQALDEAASAETFNEGLVRDRAAELAAVDADIAVARANIHAQILQILTADQKTKLQELQARMKERRARVRNR